MEEERPRAVQRGVSTEPFREFVAELQQLSGDFDRLVANFAWCATQIAGDQDASSRLRGMMEFALRYQDYGMERANETLGQDSGIRVDIGTPHLPSKTRPGILAGLIGARNIGGDKFFVGLAVTENRKGQEAWVAVRIKLNGEIVLSPKYEQPEDPETVRLMRELYPHTH